MYIAQQFLNTAHIFDVFEADGIFLPYETSYYRLGTYLHTIVFADDSHCYLLLNERNQLVSSVAYGGNEPSKRVTDFLYANLSALDAKAGSEVDQIASRAVHDAVLLRQSIEGLGGF